MGWVQRLVMSDHPAVALVRGNVLGALLGLFNVLVLQVAAGLLKWVLREGSVRDYIDVFAPIAQVVFFLVTWAVFVFVESRKSSKGTWP